MSQTPLQELLSEEDYSQITDPDYQANMFLIESAMRELGHTAPPPFKPSTYDDALMTLIDSVPRE